ncbi:MAG: hypothetical protein JXB50_10625 [Spirochaetes bacterium]|nr:hypothetical protein [Spirochaetota bacterium]
MKNIITDWLDLYSKKIKPETIIELPVLSGSMMPYLVPGKKIYIKSYNDEKIYIGDIVVFKKNNKLNAHRVLFKLKFKKCILIYEKGDVNPTGTWIKNTDIVGIVFFSVNSDDKKLNFRNIKMLLFSKFIVFKQYIKILLHYIKKIIKKTINH